MLFKSLLQVALLATMALPATASVDTLSEDVLANLAAMRAVYRAEYAPAEWKKKYVSYDLETEYMRAVDAVRAEKPLTMKVARQILRRFIYAMQDYHVSISFVATETASLPLTIKGAGDRYFIAYIDRNKLSEDSFPFHIGDEVMQFDGKPVAEAVAEVQAETPANVPATDKAMAEYALTLRRASRGLNVPHGPVELGIKAKGSTQIQTQQLIWDYSPELIASPSAHNGLFSTNKKTSSLFRPHMETQMLEPMAAGNPYGVGARVTFTPDLGTKIWESADDNVFNAYIYQNEEGKLIGYVRISAYVVDDYVKAVADFAKIIKRFEATTQAMVIDQVNNPGGSVFYLYTLASMLSDQPLKTPRHRMSITQADVQEALKMIEALKSVKNDEDAKKVLNDFDGYPVSYEFARFTLSYAQFFVDQWNAGHKLTEPYWIAGVDHINPGAVNYTKPILLLVNNLDFSGGDFFPTILQDNQRATILGARTAGAGGYVNDITIPNNIGVAGFRCTESIAERVNGNPIENLGVTPDIAYEMSADDYTKNYAPYLKVIRDSIKDLIK